MPTPVSVRRRAALPVAVISAGVLAVIGPGQIVVAEALSTPSGLSVQHRNSSTPVLSWNRVGNADQYEIQVDDDPQFDSVDYASSTANSQIVPSNPLPGGTVHWRVRARAGSSTSAWSAPREFVVAAPDVPTLQAPADGADLQQPDAPPLLRWSTSKGAVSYTVQLDGDPDFIGAKSHTTQSTSFVWPEALPAGDWWWRVTASKGGGVVSRPSAPASFNIFPLKSPVLTSPEDSHIETVEDVVLDWEPVPGARSYDVQVALDDNFQNFATQATNIRGTRFSPDVTIHNDEFWWRVRAVDTAGQSTPWEESEYHFKRQWLDRATPIWPLGTAASPGTQGVDSTYFQWSPVQHATYYQLEVARDLNFTQGLIQCVTAGTTYVPRFSGNNDCLSIDAVASGGQPRYWRVRPLDRPYPDPMGLPGVFSEPQAFVRTPQPEAGPASGPVTHATGLKVSATGQGVGASNEGCEKALSVGYPDADAYTKPGLCEVAVTPVFSWDRYPGAESYVIWFAQDENFTTTEVQPISTKYTRFALDERVPAANHGPWTLPESEAGFPYYWYVQPCTADGCAPRPDSQAVGVSGAASFQKVSPAVTGLTSPAHAMNDVTFSWDDYVTTNTASSTNGEAGQQAAQNYRIEVDDEPSFSGPLLDSHVVDQTTYTAKDRLYPEGTLYWRVQALDAGDRPSDTTGHGLTWSEPEMVTKASNPVVLTSPIGGETVAGTAPLTWKTQAFAVNYELEVYKNNDAALSSTNRVLRATTGTTAYAPREPLPASAQAYVWRVRRIDSSGNPGPWSDLGRFKSKGAVPELLKPTDGSLVPSNRALFVWSDVPGAASFRLTASTGTGSTLTKTTTATAYAPTTLSNGTWSWRVTALDSAGHSLGTSTASRFSVDAIGPTVVDYSPSSSARRKANMKVVFSEPVVRKTVNGKSFQIRKYGKKRKLRARVTVNKAGTKAVLNPSRKLKRGQYYSVVVNSRVRDRNGNRLTLETWSFRVR